MIYVFCGFVITFLFLTPVYIAGMIIDKEHTFEWLASFYSMVITGGLTVVFSGLICWIFLCFLPQNKIL